MDIHRFPYSQMHAPFPLKLSPYIRGVKLPLYKFMKREFAEGFFKDGTLRIGTIYDYRSRENHSLAAVQDGLEGVATFVLRNLGVTEQYLTTAVNNWIFCCSQTYQTRLYQDFDSDCCVVIKNLSFFYELERCVQAHFSCKPFLLRPAIYTGIGAPDRKYVSGFDFAGLVKSFHFAYQAEVRACWEESVTPQPHGLIEMPLDIPDAFAFAQAHQSAYAHQENQRMRPFFVKAPAARQFCDLIDLAAIPS